MITSNPNNRRLHSIMTAERPGSSPRINLTDLAPSFQNSLQPGSHASRIFIIFFVSAIFVIVARLFAPFEIAKDQATQLEGAFRLVFGEGLTTTATYSSTTNDVAQVPQPNFITQWPPGFSVLIAAFLYLGMPLLATLKFVFGVTSLAGWVGWAIIASTLMSTPLTFRSRRVPFDFIVAALMPVFLTPWWKGTDLFLWAAVPWMVLPLILSQQTTYPTLLTFAAGLLAGLSITFRYAGAFLLPAGALAILCLAWPISRFTFKQWAAFAIGALIFLLPLVYYLHYASTKNPIPNAWIGDEQSDALGQINASRLRRPNRVVQMVQGSHILTNLVFGLPVLDQSVRRLSGAAGDIVGYGLGLGSFLVISLLPWVALKAVGSPEGGSFRNRVLSVMSYVPLSLVASLVIITIVTEAPLFGVRRYYEPVMSVCVLIFFALAGSRAMNRGIRSFAVAMITVFTLYLTMYVPALGVFPTRRASFVQMVFSYIPSNDSRYDSTSEDIQYPSYRMYMKREATKTRLKQLHAEFPDALFFLNEAPFYTFDGLDGSGKLAPASLRDMPPKDFWQAAYISVPSKVFWVCRSLNDLAFVPLTNQRVIYTNALEGSIIVESSFPAGHRFSMASTRIE